MDEESEWVNQMVADFNDKSFNRYQEGPGANLDENALFSKIEDQKFSLCLTNIPNNLTRHGIQYYFERYGKVLDVRYTGGRKAFVDYGTLNEAEHALHVVNNGNNLGIVANFAKKAEDTTSSNEIVDFQQSKVKSSFINLSFIGEDGEIDMLNRRIKGPFTNPIDLGWATEMLNGSEKFNDIESNSDTKNMYHDDFDLYYKSNWKLIDGSELELGYYKPNHIIDGIVCFRDDPDLLKHLEDLSIKSKVNPNLSEKNFVEFNLCAVCNKLSDKYSDCCKTNYCSIECQRNDWLEHKVHCIQGVNRKSPNKLIQNMVKKRSKQFSTSVNDSYFVTPPKNHSKIMITTVINNNTLFIRSLDNNTEYLQMLNTVIYNGITAPKWSNIDSDDCPNINEYLLAKFEDNYYRAIVIQIINGNMVKVCLIDFGNCKIVSISDLRKMPVTIATLPRYTFKVKLKDIEKYTCNDEKIAEFLLSTLLDLTKLEIIYDEVIFNRNGEQLVELIECQNKRSLNQHIKQLCNIKVPTMNEEVFFDKNLTYKKITDEPCFIVILDNSLIESELLTCIKCEDIPELQRNQMSIQKYCKTQPIKPTSTYTPRYNEICLGKQKTNDNNWYRITCHEVSGDCYPAVHFVDFGNMNLIKINNIRKMPAEFLFRCCSFECSVPGLTKDDLIKNEKLKDVFKTGTKIKVNRIEEISDNFYNLYMDANQFLKKRRSLNL